MKKVLERYKQGVVFGGTLFLCLLLSSCILTEGGNTTAVEGADSVGLSPKSFVTTGLTDTNAIIDVFAGTHAVGIYGAPAGKTTGKGTLQISRDGNQIAMSLKDDAGGIVFMMNIDRGNPSAYSWFTVNPTTRNLHMGNVSDAIDANFGTDGFISGSVVHASATYYFRNNLAAFGSKVPGVFTQISGTWRGLQETETCLMGNVKPDVAVTLTATGRVSIAGRSDQTCKDTAITNQWDGQDDYIAPVPVAAGGGYEIFLDGHKSGGAQPSGGIRIQLSSLNAPAEISEAATTLAWVDGTISVRAPHKQ